MKFERMLSAAKKTRDVSVAELVTWKHVDCVIMDQGTGKEIFRQMGVEVPEQWSQNAANMLAQKYFRKAGVPDETISVTLGSLPQGAQNTLPGWLWPRQRDFISLPPLRGEVSARQVFHRLAGAWTYHGWLSGLLASEEEAQVFYDECYLALAWQYAAPNSPQWFNTGLWWAYGISGPDSGMWICDDGTPVQIKDSYSRPQPHACFLTTVKDDLVNEGGIMDAWVREARIFKHGSGSGMNVSALRAKGELLSGGGKSSGVMSWLRIGDSSAGAIQSGGTTRRAAVMRIMDIDHPEIESFINWKVREEHKAASMYVGSQLLRNVYLDVGSFEDPHIAFPPQVVERTSEFEPVILGVGWEEEANRTIDGQNSNNSVRATDEFMQCLEDSEATTWNLRARTTGEVMRSVPPRDLWDQICKAAWACADPGLLFHDTINRWNTCKADGQIKTTNPCAEYHFMDDTACNLASLKLTAFRDGGGKIHLKLFEHVVRLFTVVLDISISMASFPAREFALGTYSYRTLGLGYADLGGLLMRIGIPYDSDEGRSWAAALTALMTGIAYRTSAQMAREVAPFPRWQANRESFMSVMQMHADAVGSIRTLGTEVSRIVLEAEAVWRGVLSHKSFRNAQATLIAPTGTISFVMDCDTTGMECELALRKYKHLAGGGTMRIVNPGVPEALQSLGYDQGAIDSVVKNIENCGSVSGFAWKDPAHEAVFDCANPAPGEERCLRWPAHVEMLAAIQPFLSGAASKTINLPNSATVQDVSDAYMLCWKRGVKAVALYRDRCKLSQPLQTAPIERAAAVVAAHPAVSKQRDMLLSAFSPTLGRGQKEFLPWRRSGGYTQKAKIGSEGQSVFWRVSEFEDGRPGEIFIVLAGEGSTMRAFAECLAIQMSVSLQHGTSVEAVAEPLLHIKFEPSGFVEGHDHIKFASSIADLIATDLLITYCGRKDLSVLQEHAALGDPEKIVALDRRGLAARGQPTGEPCPRCQSELHRDGRCRQCGNCGWNEGCSS